MIPDSFKQDLLNRVDIVELIERYVPLRKGGSNYAACCPFHTEKSPSFTVSPTKQFYHCFGCGAHGNAISFLMEYQGLGYIDALKDLAESVGMKLPEQSREVRRDAPGPDLYEIMERAARYFREQLKASPQAVDYLKGRGLTGQVAARFGIGYAPPGWQNLQSVFTDYAGAALKEAGLVIDAEGGRRYDRFRDRIMFPILNQRGAVIGFGGRVLGQGEPKYLNSPETPLFEKGRELYGLSQARNAIRTEARAVVTEGYMDVVALAQHGIEFAVATLGTATSAVHVQKLFRMTGEVVFCFDGDAAGRRAAWHALEVALPVLADDKVVRFMFLPQEDDPDSFVRSRGAESFKSMVAQARPLSEFLLSELRSRADTSTAEGRSRLVAEAKPLLKKIAAPALQLQLLRELADAARMETADVARLLEIRVAAPAGRRNMPRSEPPRRSSGDELVGRRLLRCVLASPQLALQVRGFAEQNDAPPFKALLAIADVLEDAPEASAAWLIDRFGDADFAPLLAEARAQLLELRLEADELEAEFRDELMRLKTIALAHQIGALKDKASRQGLSSAESDEYNRLIKEHAALKQLPREQHNAL